MPFPQTFLLWIRSDIVKEICLYVMKYKPSTSKLDSLLIFPKHILKNLLTCFLSSTNVSSLYYFPVIIFYIFLYNHFLCHLSQGNMND